MLDYDKWMGLSRFSRSVTSHLRYLRTRECNEFLHEVLETAERRVEPMEAGREFWRAQVGCLWGKDEISPGESVDVPIPYPAKRMKPLEGRAIEGRVNPKGIPCLYGATDNRTAVAETRAWKGARVTVAKFQIVRPLKIVNCTLHARRPTIIRVGGTPLKRDWEAHVWHRIDKAFSRPVTPCDDLADYAPTQILAELFKRHGYHGIAYASSLGPGHNLAIFNPDHAKPLASIVMLVTDVRFRIKQEADSPASIRHYTRLRRAV